MNIEPATIESGNNIALHKTLDIRLKEIGDNHAVAEVTIGDKHKNYYGGGHGGVIATLIDVVSFLTPLILSSKIFSHPATVSISICESKFWSRELTNQSKLDSSAKDQNLGGVSSD